MPCRQYSSERKNRMARSKQRDSIKSHNNNKTKTASRMTTVTNVATIIGTMVGMIALIAFYSEVRSREITVFYGECTPIINDSVSPNTKFAITYNGEMVASPYITPITIRSTGSDDIPSRDIEGELTVQFDCANVLDAYIARLAPDNIEAALIVSEGGISISHGLLNPGDIIQLEIITPELCRPVNARARIARVGSIPIVPVGTTGATTTASPFYFAMPKVLEWLFAALFATCTVIIMLGMAGAMFNSLKAASEVKRDPYSFERSLKKNITIGAMTGIPDGHVLENIRPFLYDGISFQDLDSDSSLAESLSLHLKAHGEKIPPQEDLLFVASKIRAAAIEYYQSATELAATDFRSSTKIQLDQTKAYARELPAIKAPSQFAEEVIGVIRQEYEANSKGVADISRYVGIVIAYMLMSIIAVPFILSGVAIFANLWQQSAYSYSGPHALQRRLLVMCANFSTSNTFH